MKFRISLFLGVLTIFTGLGAHADDIKVLSTIGTVNAVVNNEKRSVSRGSQLKVNETIVTGPGSRAQLYFSDGTKVQIEENTTFALNGYQYRNNNQDELEVSLIEGGIRWLSGDAKDVTRVRTRVALTGIRGTYFMTVFTKSTQILGIYSNSGYMRNDGGEASLGEDENFHLARAISWKIKPEYLLEELGEYYDAFRPIEGKGKADDSDLDKLINEIGDYFGDSWDQMPSDPYRRNPWDGFIDFAYDNYFNSCRCHGK